MEVNKRLQIHWKITYIMNLILILYQVLTVSSALCPWGSRSCLSLILFLIKRVFRNQGRLFDIRWESQAKRVDPRVWFCVFPFLIQGFGFWCLNLILLELLLEIPGTTMNLSIEVHDNPVVLTLINKLKAVVDCLSQILLCTTSLHKPNFEYLVYVESSTHRSTSYVYCFLFHSVACLGTHTDRFSLFFFFNWAIASQERIIERLKEQRERDDRERLEEIESFRKENKDLKEKVNALQAELTEKEVSLEKQVHHTSSPHQPASM